MAAPKTLKKLDVGLAMCRQDRAKQKYQPYIFCGYYPMLISVIILHSMNKGATYTKNRSKHGITCLVFIHPLSIHLVL